MNTPSSSVPETTSQAIAPPAISPARLLYWSVRRELWENRSIYIAPLCAAGVVLSGFLIALLHHAAKGTLQAPTLDAAKQPWPIERPYEIVAVMILFTAFLVGSSTASTRCTGNVAIAAFCSGSRCRFRISPPCSRRRAFRSSFCRRSPSPSSWPRSSS